MSIEEVERVLDETQEAVEYQRVGAAVSLGPAGARPAMPRAALGVTPAVPCAGPLFSSEGTLSQGCL